MFKHVYFLLFKVVIENERDNGSFQGVDGIGGIGNWQLGPLSRE